MKRFLAIAVGGVLLLGCHGSDGGDDDDSGSSGFTPGPSGGPSGSGQTLQFSEAFEAGFPGSNWTMTTGAPVIAGDLGQPPPALVLGSAGESVLLQTPFMFSTSGPFTLSFDFSIPAPKPTSAQFEMRLAPDDHSVPFASVIVPATPNHLILNIGDQSQQFPFAPDAQFHKLTFQVLEDRTATWALDGGVIMSRRDFPIGTFRILFLGHGNAPGAGIAVDSIALTKP
jgi:hypothetical protein